MAVCQNLVPLVNIKIAGKWMFIPLKMVLIGIDPYPYYIMWLGPTLFVAPHLLPIENMATHSSAHPLPGSYLYSPLARKSLNSTILIYG
jgi:hypothetical protein